MLLVIPEKILDTIHQHAIETYNNECCGFLYAFNNNQRIVTESQPASNSQEGDQKKRYFIAPNQYLRAEQYALEYNLTLLGIYHSHPDHPASPSEYDRSHALPFFSYVIISVINGKIKETTSWILQENGFFQQEKIKIDREKEKKMYA